MMIHITRPTPPTNDPHISEADVEVQRTDFVIRNDGSLQDFLRNVEELADEIEGVPIRVR
jgi:dephospho-CoA kinase